MNTRKSFISALIDLLKAYIAVQPGSISGGIRRWLPSRGNLLLVGMVAGALLLANRAGALTLFAPNAPSTQVMPYQGRLAGAGGVPLTGSYAMTFALYDVVANGVPLWTETWTGPNSVTVRDGLFNVALGSLTVIPQSAIANRANVWLGITVGSDTEMNPRVQLGSVPFAVQALTVPDGSITAAKFAPGVSFVPPAGSITTTMLSAQAMPVYFATTQSANWTSPLCTSSGGMIVPGLQLTVTLTRPAILDISHTSLVGNDSTTLGVATYTMLFIDDQLAITPQGDGLIGGCRNGSSTAPLCQAANVVAKPMPPGTHTIDVRIGCDGNGHGRVWGGTLRVVAFPN